MKTLRPNQPLPVKHISPHTSSGLRQEDAVPTAKPEDLAAAGVTEDEFQLRYEALYRMWVTGSYSDRVDSDLGRSLNSWLRKRPITPLTIAVITDNVEYVREAGIDDSMAWKWFDRACVAGSARVGPYLKSHFGLVLEDDGDSLFEKVGASGNIGWIQSLLQELKLTELPDATFHYIRDVENFNKLHWILKN